MANMQYKAKKEADSLLTSYETLSTTRLDKVEKVGTINIAPTLGDPLFGCIEKDLAVHIHNKPSPRKFALIGYLP